MTPAWAHRQRRSAVRRLWRRLGWSAAVVLVLLGLPAQAAPADAVVADVNLRHIHRSELRAAIKEHGGSVKVALDVLVRRALLLQEAARSGWGEGLPAMRRARADAFLRRVISRDVICGNINERDLQRMYAMMRPRFVHGDLYRVSELQWRCRGDGAPESAHCEDEARRWTDERWRPVVDAIVLGADLWWLGQLEHPPGNTRYVEYTFQVDDKGRSSLPPAVTDPVRTMTVGQTKVTTAGPGARIQLLLEHRLPEHRRLSDPKVRAAVQAELCPRLVQRSRKTYLDGLVAGAHVNVYASRLPVGHDWTPSPSR